MQAVQSEDHQGDNLFGVCAAIGEDLGFNPLYLRITFGVLLLWNPVAVLGTYAFLGVAVLISRLLFPKKSRKAAAKAAAPVVAIERAPAPAEPVAEVRELELAEAA